MTNSYKGASVPQVLKIPNPKDNFGLTKLEFDQFVEKVKDGDESLFIKVFNVHFKSSVRYIQNKFSIAEEAAYDTCMDTLLEFRSKLKTGKIKYGNVRYLFTKMAVHKYLDGLKKKNKVNDAIQVFLGENSKLALSESEFLSTLNYAVNNLEKAQKYMIKEIFYSGKDTEQIIEENDITYSTFRKRKQRSLEKLKSSFLGLINKNQLK